MASRIQKNDNRNCFLRPESNQYTMKITWANSNNGTAKLMIDNKGNDCGEI